MAPCPVLWVLACCALQADDTTKTLKEFTSKEGRFKVLMPGTPKEQKQKTAGIDFTMYVIEGKDGASVVGYADLPIPAGADPQTVLDGAAQGMVGAVGGKLDKANKIELAKKYPGREVFATVPQMEGHIRARIYMVDKRLYQLIVVGKKDQVDKPEVAKFLESFELVEEKKEKPEK